MVLNSRLEHFASRGSLLAMKENIVPHPGLLKCFAFQLLFFGFGF